MQKAGLLITRPMYINTGVTSIGVGGGVAQWLGRRISDQGVPGSNPGRCTFRYGLEQVTFTLLKLVSLWDATISRLVGDKGLRYKRDFLPFFRLRSYWTL